MLSGNKLQLPLWPAGRQFGGGEVLSAPDAFGHLTVNDGMVRMGSPLRSFQMNKTRRRWRAGGGSCASGLGVAQPWRARAWVLDNVAARSACASCAAQNPLAADQRRQDGGTSESRQRLFQFRHGLHRAGSFCAQTEAS